MDLVNAERSLEYEPADQRKPANICNPRSANRELAKIRNYAIIHVQ